MLTLNGSAEKPGVGITFPKTSFRDTDVDVGRRAGERVGVVRVGEGGVSAQ